MDEGLGDPSDLVLTPATLIITQGESTFVNVEVRDQHGNQLAADFTVGTIGAGVAVREDDSFLLTNDGSRLLTEARFIVKALTPSATSFELSASGVTETVPVIILPPDIDGTFSAAASGVNDTVTLTAPQGFTFAADASVTFGEDVAIMIGRAGDGTSISFIPAPGSRGPATVTGVVPGYAPTLSLEFATVDTVVVDTTTPFAGREDPGTAPAIPFPANGGSIQFFDAFPGGLPAANGNTVGDTFYDQFYAFTLAQTDTVTITTNWPGDADLDQVICFNVACSAGDASAATVNHPESGKYILAPGTYYLLVEIFDAPASNPTYWDITIQR